MKSEGDKHPPTHKSFSWKQRRAVGNRDHTRFLFDEVTHKNQNRDIQVKHYVFRDSSMFGKVKQALLVPISMQVLFRDSLGVRKRSKSITNGPEQST